MFGCRLPGARRRTKWSAKRVESSGVPCLDAGSTPATSTLGLRLSQAFFLCGVRGARCAQRRATMLPYVAEDCLLANKFSANNPHPRALRSRLCFVVKCSACVGGAVFIRGCRICGNQVPANDGFDWMSIQSSDPRHLHLGSAICRRPFFVCGVRGARCCAQRRATMLPLYFSPVSPVSPVSPQKNNSSLLTTPCYDKACYYRQKLF